MSATPIDPWRTLSRRQVLDLGKFLRVEVHAVELPDGRVIDDWPWAITPDYVNVVAITHKDEYLLFRQTTYALDGTSLAPVGGYLEPGEEPLAAARRELLEETGYEADEWTSLGDYWVDANRGVARAYFFLARGALPVAEPESDDLEEQVLVHLARREVVDALREWQPHENKQIVLARALPVVEQAWHEVQGNGASGPVARFSHGGPILALLSALGIDDPTLETLRIYDHRNPLPPAGVWQVSPGDTGAQADRDLRLVFVPPTAQTIV